MHGIHVTDLENVGSAALDRFIETFNSRDATAWAASLSYPHVRVSPRQASAVVSPTQRDYADAVTYRAADAMGWDHSEWDTKEILAVSPSKIHASAQWCRYNAAGDRILPNNVSYVVTKVDERWGIQARFGVDSPPPDDPDSVAESAHQAWTRLWEALATGGTEDIDQHVRYPFHVVGTGEVTPTTTGDDLLAYFGRAAQMTPRTVTPLQVGEQGVNLGVELTGADSGTVHGLFLVSLHDTTPRVAAASLLSGG